MIDFRVVNIAKRIVQYRNNANPNIPLLQSYITRAGTYLARNEAARSLV